MAAARRARHSQLHAGGEAARASAFSHHAALRDGSRDRLAPVNAPAVPRAQPAAGTSSPRFAVPVPCIQARRSPACRYDASRILVPALSQSSCNVGPADTHRAAALLVEELRHLDARERQPPLAAAVDAADGVLERALA